MKNIRNILSAFAILFAFTFLNAQSSTYKIGKTEYIYGEYYSTTGKPKVVRSEPNKKAFLISRGFNSTPYGYEIDHIIPLSQGGSDDPSNMQLLTITQHRDKTTRERSNIARTYSYTSSKPFNYNYSNPLPKFKRTEHVIPRYITPTYSVPNNFSQSYSTPSTSNRVIYTGSRGGKYYINSNGNKTYVKD